MVRRFSMHLPLIVVLCATHLQAHGFAPLPVYSLPPEKLRLAEALFRTRTLLHFGGAAWGMVQLVLLLALRVPAKLREAAKRVSGNRWVQCFLFTVQLLLTMTLLDLPLAVYGHQLSLSYGLSVQGWGSWFGDLSKEFVLNWVLTGSGTMLVFWLIRRSPRRWWLWFWFPAMAAAVLGVLVAPVLIDPLFGHFEPLSAHDPALVARLEQVVGHGPLRIPPERMFWMDASKKYTGLNAYVTGMGPSKRVVVWDTSIASATTDEISFIFGHEMGHYVLNHIYKTLVFAGVLLLAAFWVGFHLARWLLGRYGAAWGIASQGDWAALAVYLLVLAVSNFALEPLTSGYSRMQEHAADVYGQEAVHGIVADPAATAVQAFQLLGEKSLDTPIAHPLVEWWSYGHPAIRQRVAFAAGYDPWAESGRPRYFAK